MKIQPIGVYSVDAPEPCCLVELSISEIDGKVNIEQFTQEVPGQPESNWQVPYDERVLNDDGTDQVGDRFPSKIVGKGNLRLGFFFHHLDVSEPLLSPAGPINLPVATGQPERLEFFEYEEH